MSKLIALRSGPVIPYELIELIIALIATEDDIETLLALALLDHHFSWVARRYIFSYIPLEKWKYQQEEGGQIASEAEQFHRILDRNPGVAAFVHKFDYVNDLKNSHHAPAVFRRLYNVKSFTFGFNDYEIYGPRQANWNTSISAALRKSIYAFFQGNSLRSLQMLNIADVPGILFELLPCLEELDLHSVTFSGWKNVALNSSLKVPEGKSSSGDPLKLKALTMRRKMESGFAYIMDAKRRNGRHMMDYSQVMAAHFHIEHPDMVSTFLEFLNRTEQLTELAFGGYCGEFDIKNRFTSSLNPNSFQTLRRLEFWHMVDGRQYDPFAGLSYELAELAYRARGAVVLPLAEVSIGIQVDTDGACDTSPDVWSQLDIALSQPKNFPHLRTVNVKVTIYYCRGAHLENLVQELHIVEKTSFNGLRELQRRGLNFSFKVTKKPV
ncbi:hypothetical protein CVT24_006920 [Panaeolus cyanescens]|uniref:F-box domain-containing protein n=1 Tax=Panaeolus cyanescens TaxID=181874 RepID=A0A409VK07_9AGAR|nr:hypothetical protein CVT24_006920 [Panaeolus cyanescens]